MAASPSPLFALVPSGYPAGFVIGSVASLSLFVPEPPQPKGRHRSRVVTPPGKKPFVQNYQDKKTEAYEATIAEHCRAQISQLDVQGGEMVLPFKGRLAITLRFNFRKPPSYPKSVEHHVHRPDVDNLAKAVLDALQVARIIEEDNQVTDLVLSKRYQDARHPEGVEIDITAW